MKSNPVGLFEIYVQDMPRAKAFYEAVFQGLLEELKNPDPNGFPEMEMWAFPMSMEGSGAAGALVKMAGCPSGGSTLVYFPVRIAQVRLNEQHRMGEKFSKERCQLVSMALLRWLSIPKAIRLAFIQCNECMA